MSPIFSANLSSVGRSTHAGGTGGAHLEYITRASACRLVLAENMPTAAPGSKGGKARTWLDAQELKDRKNARVCDKIMLALPRELDHVQRHDLVRAFVHDLTGGAPVPWLAAFHDKGAKGEHNPHCHLVLRDRHAETGKRVVNTSEKGSVDRVRLAWERTCNAALAAAGSDARIDRRSLRAQGIDRKPQGHEGPQARSVEAKGLPSIKLARVREAREGPGRGRQAAQMLDEAREARDAAQRALEAARGALEASRRPSAPPFRFERRERPEEPQDDGLDFDLRPAPFDPEEGDDPEHWRQHEAKRVERLEARAAAELRTWSAELPAIREALAEVEVQPSPSLATRAAELFDWMRALVIRVRDLLGPDHATSRQVRMEWEGQLGAHPCCCTIVAVQDEQQAKALHQEADAIRAELDARRRPARDHELPPRPAPSPWRGPSGPGM